MKANVQQDRHPRYPGQEPEGRCPELDHRVPDTFTRRAVKPNSHQQNPALTPAAETSRVDEDVVIAGRGFIAFHGTGHESQDAAIAIDATALAQHGAIRLVAVDRATLQVHRAIEGIDPPAQGRRAVRLVGIYRAVGQRQKAVFTGDPAAQGSTR